jgi:hypothetical protein
MVKLIPVYYLGESLRAPAKFFYHPDQIAEWFSEGAGTWNKKLTVFILKRLPASMYRAAASLTMGSKVIEMAAAGSAYHMSLVAGWRPYMRAA